MWPLILLCTVGGVVVLDYSVVFIAVPSIQQDLGVSPGAVQWLANAYALAFGALLMLGGRLGDHLGRRRVLQAGLGLFTASSLLLALSPDTATFLVGRVAQGVGAALLAPAALALLTVIYREGRERARAVGAYGAVAGAAGAFGALLGGVLTEYASWHWAFLINLPLGVAALALTPRLLPSDGPLPRWAQVRSRLDLPGAATVTLGLFALVFGISRAEHGGPFTAEVLVPTGAGVALLVAFVAIERRTTEPLVPLSIFRLRGISVGNGTYLVVGAGTFGALFLLSIYLQQVLQYPALQAGLALLPLALGSVLASILATSVMQRVGVRVTVVGGLAFLATGLLLLTRIGVDSTFTNDLLPGQLVTALGLGLVVVPLTAMATDDVPADRAGLASGLFSTAQELGGALGLAILTTVASTVAGVAVAGGTDATAAQVQGLQTAFGVAAGLSVLALAVAWVAAPRRGDAASAPTSTANSPDDAVVRP